MLSNLKIGPRLILGYAAVTALMVISIALSFVALDRVSNSMRHMITDRYGQISTITQIKHNGNKGLILVGRILLAKTPDQAQKYLDQYATIREANAANYKVLEESLQTSSQEIKSLFNQQADARKDYGAALKKVFDLVKAGDSQQAMQIYETEVTRLQQRYYELIDKMVDVQAKGMEDDAATTAASTATSKWLMGGMLLIALGASITVALVITKSIVQPIDRALHLATAVAKGDLSQRIDIQGNDEVAALLSALRQMTENLHKIVANVRQGTETINSAASEVAGGNMDLSRRTEAQASSLEETAAAMEELTSAVKHNAENANLANQRAASASAVATEGGEAVGQMINTMNSISESSKRIVEIISVIDGIAFQTNILALNAAVEAARAGEQGRGFAVVASEVRALAGRSAEAAKEIKGLIAHSSTQVEAGAKMVEQAGETMRTVVNSIQEVSQIVADISASTQEQSSGIVQINQAISHMDDTTQKNAALVEQSTAAAKALQQQAEQLDHMVHVFQLSQQPSYQLAH